MRIVLATSNPHKLAELRAILAAEGLADRIRLLSLDEAGGPFPEPPESGSTFEENAALKARAYARATGLPCIADDSGLEVDALAGRPGVISSHYCTSGQPTDLPREQRDRLNNDRLLRDLAAVPLERRSARFVCVMALALPTTPPLATEPHHAEAGPFQATSGAGPFQAPQIPEAGPSSSEAGSFQPLQPSDSPLSLHDALATFRGTFEGRIGLPGDVPRGTHGFGYDPIFLVAPHYTRTSAELAPDEKNRLSHRAKAARQLARFLRALPFRPE